MKWRLVAWLPALAAWMAVHSAASPPTLTVQPVGNRGFDVYANGVVVAPLRLAANDAILADKVEVVGSGLRLSGLRAKDPLAVQFAGDDFVSVEPPPEGGPGSTNATAAAELLVRFKLTLGAFDAKRWTALFPDGAAPFHFLLCSMPTAQVWHQRGWLNATPNADPFPLLQDVHVGSPELSAQWNRNWSYICPLGAHPIPVIGVWDPAARLYVGYDFQGARATDQSERYVATAYCWQQGAVKSFITLAFPHGGLRYGNQVYPRGGEVVASWFHLIVDSALPAEEDPNERFQTRLFARYADALPAVPAMNDLAWVPGKARLNDFQGPIGLELWGPGGETTFYPTNTLLVYGWNGHLEMPIDTAVRRGLTQTVATARARLESLLHNYAKTFTVDGETCLFWEKPLSGAWKAEWGGAPVTTLHNADGWYPARVLVELYRYDRSRGQAKAEYLQAIDGLFNWARHFVWTRNEFADVPSSPFAIGSTLSAAFLLDYHFTFKDDPQRRANAQLALRLAGSLIWRYLPIWAMDSDRLDGALDSAFLVEPNSGRDWAGLGCANEVNWVIDAATQVYVHTGDPRLRYYLRGVLQRWPALYRPLYKDSLADYGNDALTEGLGLFDGSGPGRGERYSYGFSVPLSLNEPVGKSTLRVVAGERACIAFTKNGTGADVADYRTDGKGACSFRLVGALETPFELSFSYPFVDVSRLTVKRIRAGQTHTLGSDELVRPVQSPSSLYLRQLRNGDTVTIGTLAADTPIIPLATPLVFVEGSDQPKTRGAFTMLPLRADDPLPQDWNDLRSFAGIIAGERWLYGVPYRQGNNAVTNAVTVNGSGAKAVLVVFAPPLDGTLSRAPLLKLDDGAQAALSGKPALAWRGWPPIFQRVVLMDYALVPAGRLLREVDPQGTLLMAVTLFQGDQNAWAPVQTALAAAGADFLQAEMQRQAMLSLKASFAQLPADKLALLPRPASGAAAAFCAMTGLEDKWVALSETQLVDPAWFTAGRQRLAFYLSGERYVKTVAADGDGKAAVTRFLAGGGTLVLLASEPFPFFYGDGPGGKSGPADPLLPTLGLPIEIAFETAPPDLSVQVCPGQTILKSVPSAFPFPPGDPRLRPINRSRVDAAHRYVPLLRVTNAQGFSYGEAAAFIEFRAGPAKGGKILYVWSTLLSGPQGQAIMGDVVSWILDGTLRPPRFDSIRALDSAHLVLTLMAMANLRYTLEYRDTLTAGAWSLLRDFPAALTNRTLAYTNLVSGLRSRFYRLAVRP